MSLPFYIARRIPLRSSSKGIGGGVAVSVTGITLSIVIILIAVAVLTGFRNEIKQKVMGFESQIAVAYNIAMADDETSILLDSCDVDTISQLLPEYASASLVIRQPAILKTAENFGGCVVKGIEANGNLRFVKQNLVAGAVPDYTADSTRFHAVISQKIARELNVGVGDKLDTYFLGNEAYRLRRLKVAGIYDTHFSDYDKNFIFASIEMLRGVGRLPQGTGTVLEITGLTSDEEIDRVGGELTARLVYDKLAQPESRHFAVQTIHERAAVFYSWLSLLDTNVIVILSLMGLLASLTLVSSLFILILRRVRMIGILKAMGASNRLIRKTFIILSLRLLLLGLLLGNLIGIGIVVVQRLTGIIPLNPEAYYLDHVPMQLSLAAVLAVNIGVCLVSVCVLILPSSIVSRISPSKAISYE